MIGPTQIAPLGLIGDTDGRRLNLSRFAISPSDRTFPITAILVAGTAMNSGKTYSAASLVRGLKANGFRVAGIKSTGTGAGGDLWQMRDLGADLVLDFTDAGFASTYRIPADDIENGVLNLINHAGRRRCDVAVVEIADGLQHQETAILLGSERLRQRSAGLLFAAYDSMGAVAGVEALLLQRHNVIAVSGQLTRSPLAMREAGAALSCPIHTPQELQAGSLVQTILNIRNRAAKASRDSDQVTKPSLVSLAHPKRNVTLPIAAANDACTRTGTRA
jgi:molybdopterin-guanine dinucleotide biosynthesis protein